MLRFIIIGGLLAYGVAAFGERQREAMDSCLKKFSESTCVYTLR